MHIGALFLHNMRSEPCPAWTIRGQATGSEIQQVFDVMSKLVSYEQDAGFNEWQFTTYVPGHFIVKRFTWDAVWQGTIDELLQRIVSYYKSR